jgi:4-alpha-glucanotransferase
MKTSESTELIRRARRCGVQPVFVDSSGRRREASAETLRAMVELLGETERAPRPLPPVIIAWDGKAKSVRMDPAVKRSLLDVPLTLVPREYGGKEQRHINLHLAAKAPAVLQLPPLPLGYYDLCFDLEGRQHRTLIISAPVKVYTERGSRDWGVFVPMYAVHSEESWGAGNLSDWQRLCEWLAALGGPGTDENETRRSNIVVATLPLLGAFLDDWKCEPSPYSPATRLFWNEFYLDVTRVPEFTASRAAQRLVNLTAFQRELQKLRRAALVDYKVEMGLKRRILEALAAAFFRSQGARRASFDAFRKQRPELERYAQFRAVCEKRQESWHSWPHRLRDGELQAGDYDEGVARYHLFAQWLAQEQMDAVLGRCRELGVKFYLDLPLGVNPDGYDVWNHQHLFVNGASVGAPPDAFFTKGQNWGFPPLHPQRLREDGYRYVIDYLRFQMRHTGLLRLDHVMGLHRLWWVPPDVSAADGAYVSYDAEELYAVLSLESHLHRTTLIGENLGTVPSAVTRHMQRHGIRGMYVAQYDAQPNPKRALRPPTRASAASLNTHDMPMWAAFWDGLDIIDRQKLGLLSPRQARQEHKRRARVRSALADFLRRKMHLPKPAQAAAALAALIGFLGHSGAELVLVNLEDFWLETEPQNTPGTSTERVNWRRKARPSFEQIRQTAAVLDLLQRLKKARTDQAPAGLARQLQ